MRFAHYETGDFFDEMFDAAREPRSGARALSQFIDTGHAGSIVAVSCAAILALDALYGLMAPERQKQRDKMLRRLMKRRA